MRFESRESLLGPLARPLERKDAGGITVTPEVKKLFDDLQTGFTAFRTKNDEALAELKAKGVTDIVLKEHVDRINTQLGKMQERLDQKSLESKRPSIKGFDGTDREMSEVEVEHKSAFMNWFRKGRGEEKLMELEQKALSAGSNPDGGYTVPIQIETAIGRIVTDISPIRQIAQVINIGTGLYKKPVNLTGTNSGWVSEAGTRPQTNTAQLSELAFPAHEMYAMPAATQTLLDDSNVNIEEWLAGEVRIELARQEGAAFVNGNGVGKPMGFLSYPTIADASYTWGNVGYIATGQATFDADPDGADNFIDCIYALKPTYRGSGQWIMNRNTLSKVRQFQDSQGRYIWQPSLILGQPQSLLGYPLMEAEDMPSVADLKFPVAFADWKSAYIIVDRIGIRVLRDPFSSKPYVLFYTTKRVGGGIQNYEAIKLIKTAAS